MEWFWAEYWCLFNWSFLQGNLMFHVSRTDSPWFLHLRFQEKICVRLWMLCKLLRGTGAVYICIWRWSINKKKHWWSSTHCHARYTPIHTSEQNFHYIILYSEKKQKVDIWQQTKFLTTYAPSIYSHTPSSTGSRDNFNKNFERMTDRQSDSNIPPFHWVGV